MFLLKVCCDEHKHQKYSRYKQIEDMEVFFIRILDVIVSGVLVLLCVQLRM